MDRWTDRKERIFMCFSLVTASSFRGDYEFEGPSIVYCPSRKEAERVSIALYKLGITGGLYHAGLGIKQRRESQHSFMRDEIQVGPPFADCLALNRSNYNLKHFEI